MRAYDEVVTMIMSVFADEDIQYNGENDMDNDMGCITVKGCVEIFKPDETCPDRWEVFVPDLEEMEMDDIHLSNEQKAILGMIGEVQTWGCESVEW